MKKDKPIKVDKWDTNATKNALDDGIKKILNEDYKFDEKFSLIDLRLFISTMAVLCGGVAVLYDWLYPFPESKLVLIICVIMYFILTSILTFYIMFIEKHTFYVANENDSAGLDKPVKWTFKSKMKKFQDKYDLNVTRYNPNNNTRTYWDCQKSIAEYFDIKGNLRTDLLKDFVEELKKSLEVKKTN